MSGAPHCKLHNFLLGINLTIGSAALNVDTSLPPPPPFTSVQPSSSRQLTPVRPTHSQASSSQTVVRSPVISRSQSTLDEPPIAIIYQHVRNLRSIIRSITKPPSVAAEDDDDSVPDLGPATNKYLRAHGYTVGSISQVEHAISIYDTSEAQFINYLNSRGMPWKEAEYVWGLLQMDRS